LDLPNISDMPTRESCPDALILGAPKAGTTALHAALARHPQVYASPVKEPKYYLCGDAPPPGYTGPGDAHSQREWVWRQTDYAALFAPAPPESLRLESTPFYLYVPTARRRIAEELPQARLIVVVRDPIDRAYSNWMHLWVDGLEPIGDFVAAWHAEHQVSTVPPDNSRGFVAPGLRTAVIGRVIRAGAAAARVRRAGGDG
jgi:Sulfotransferase family